MFLLFIGIYFAPEALDSMLFMDVDTYACEPLYICHWMVFFSNVLNTFLYHVMFVL